ncbi:MAG: helix-turn-helix domain-containing protein [Ruminococcaceae bacterium]|nr:helix-turn-helix domain-containing protein [Oscillospiraceae bacterium]
MQKCNVCKKENTENVSENLFYKELICDTLYNEKRAFTRLIASELFEVTLVVRGSGIHRVLDKDIPCKAGDIFIVPPSVPHGYFVEQSTDKLYLRQLFFDASKWLEPDILNPSSPSFCYGVFSENKTLGYAALNSLMIEKTGDIYDNILYEAKSKESGWQSLIRGLLSSLLIYVGRYINVSLKNISFVSIEEWGIVSEAMKAVREEYSSAALSGEAIASRMHISKSHFGRIFTKLVGKSFAEYLREVRIDAVCKELKKSGANVEDIANKCGFRDIPSFYKNFSARLGMTPKEYRLKNHKFDDRSEEYIKLLRGEKIMSILNEISENLQKGKAKIVKELVMQAIDEGVKPEDVLREGLLEGMGVIGEKFKNNEVYVPEVLVAARAMNAGVQILQPLLVANGVKATGKVCIGTVRGDLHDIGKNLVKMMMEGKGLEVIDLGTDVAPEVFVNTAIEQNCQIICCSALLTTTMNVMAEVVKAAEAAGIRDKVKIMIGGAPVNQEFCDKIGADCYTVDAASAADAAVEFCKS